MGKASRWFLVAAAVVLVSGRALANEAPAPVDRTYQAVKANAKEIMAWVYPTVTFDGLAGCSWGQTAAGFVLGCRFDYVDDGDNDSRLLRFHLDGRGMIKRIEDGGGDSVFPAFFTLRVTKGMAVELAQRELAQSSHHIDADERALLRLLSRSPEPEELLAFLLNLDIASRS